MNRFFSKAVDFIDIKSLIHLLDLDQEKNSHLDKTQKIYNVSSLQDAGNGDISFLQNKKYYHSFLETKSEFCLVSDEIAKNYNEIAKNYNEKTKIIIAKDPYTSIAKLANYFYPNVNNPVILINKNPNFPFANVDITAQIGQNVQIGHGVTIEKNVTIEDNVIISHGSFIGHGCNINKNTVIYENTSIRYATIGSNCIIHSGVKIGQDGFGFAIDDKTKSLFKITHLGIVKIGNNVEIGANSCIDRGSFDTTDIHDNVKLDNLIQVGHNAKIGQSSVIAAQTAIAGSTSIGMGCMIGGQVGIAGHIKIGNFVQIGGKAGVISNIQDNEKVAGHPALPVFSWLKINAMLKKMIKKHPNNDK
ncbi:UDP-3-O-(3-hydroxymyristoyl)glucosamine N-acyltransferase [Candidatus Deianiraea vastatrix]|uniref:UDP-3-O-acylglucosamine N-acyltransferase n=1 Tax=Candidatus Deianiraea vastatrix TaxID=2163644 RepID=A0A5B8XBS8_9RICK|nr:UDP-3-O-(3-hydroxymyristoyl)glucosamine N-acyltransferase [Candidatus Deianiraea vastatrix]QED22819.1 UDP-3-O-(3-hydroxymyristoyl)glucosamine N-acyltransferase [Candidatus Deianiraea vastatrix]